MDKCTGDCNTLSTRIKFVHTILTASTIKVKKNMVLWQIPNFLALLDLQRLAQLPQLKYIASKPFTLENGYSFRIKLFANGVGSSYGTYAALYIQMA